MSSSSGTFYCSFASPARAEEGDFASAIRQSQCRGDATKEGVSPLMAMAGLASATEAYLFFQELQAGLSAIFILGSNVDELWCRLDWCSLVLGTWVGLKGHGSSRPKEDWVKIMECWLFILESAVSMAIEYASPSVHQQRRIINDDKDNIVFERMFYHLSCVYRDITKADNELVASVVMAARRKDWGSPLVHDKPFRRMVSEVKQAIAGDKSKQILQRQRRHGVERSEFASFIEDIEEEISELLTFLSDEERFELDHTINRVFAPALGPNNVDGSVRYLQVCRKIQSMWLSSNGEDDSKTDKDIRKRAQNIFQDIIINGAIDLWGKPKPPVTADLSDLIALGADVRGYVGDYTDSTLFVAALSGHSIGPFKLLMEAGAPFSKDSRSDASPLHAAAAANNTELLAFLLQSLKVDINGRDRNGRTALHWAARNRSAAAVGLLVQNRNINPDAVNDYGYTPFLEAVKAGDQATVRKLVQSKRVNCCHVTCSSENALHLTAGLKDTALSLALRYVKQVNARGRSEMTPLHEAAKNNCGSNVGILLRHGAYPIITDSQGFTPLAHACKERHLGPMKRLLRSPRSLIEQFPGPLQADARYSHEDSSHKHWSPVTLVLHDLEIAGKKTLAHVQLALEVVLAAKPDLEVRDSRGRSVLSKVIKGINKRILQDLLDAGADVNSKDNKGRSVLHRAIKNVDRDLLLVLLEAGANVNSQDDEGSTPMHRLLGRRFCDTEMLNTFLEWGADPGLKNHFGEDAIAANMESHGETWSEDPVAIIKEHRTKIARARKAQAKVKKRDQQRMPQIKPQIHFNRFSLLTVEGADYKEDN